MSSTESFRERVGHWRQRTKLQRRILARRRLLDRWYPHIPIAIAMAPLGVLAVAYATEDALGIRLASLQIADLEQRAAEFGHRPMFEAALGLSLIAMSVGLALRSRLAWSWSVGAAATGLALQLPPEQMDVPLALYFAVMLGLLLLHRGSFTSRSVVTSLGFAIIVLAAFLSWATLGTLRLGEQFDPPVRDLETALYLVVVTVSSVGRLTGSNVGHCSLRPRRCMLIENGSTGGCSTRPSMLVSNSCGTGYAACRWSRTGSQIV